MPSKPTGRPNGRPRVLVGQFSTYHLYLPEPIDRRLRQLAHNRKIPRSQLIRELLEKALANEDRA